LKISVAGVTPLTLLKNLPRPQKDCHSEALLLQFRCPKPVQISGLGQESGFSSLCTHDRLLTEKGMFSPAYHAAGTIGHAVKCHIISTVLWLNYL
jgi:hypothetical protein